MVCAQLHGCIDALHRRNAFGVNTDGLIDHWDQDPVYDKTGGLLHLYRRFSDLLRDLLYRLNRFGSRIQSRNDLHQLHHRSRVKEMHSHHMAVNACSDLCDGQGRGIGSEDTLRLADRVQLSEGLLLDLHIFNGSLHDQITVSADILYTCGDLCKDLICVLLGHLPLGDPFFKPFCDFIFTICSKRLINIAEHYFIALCLGKCLCDPGTHGSGSNHTNLHDSASLRLWGNSPAITGC